MIQADNGQNSHEWNGGDEVTAEGRMRGGGIGDQREGNPAAQVKLAAEGKIPITSLGEKSDAGERKKTEEKSLAGILPGAENIDVVRGGVAPVNAAKERLILDDVEKSPAGALEEEPDDRGEGYDDTEQEAECLEPATAGSIADQDPEAEYRCDGSG